LNAKIPSKENLNSLIKFHRAVYECVLRIRCDALFDTLDALLSGRAFTSFACLSQFKRFQRHWPILYAAVEDGQIDAEAMHQLLFGQLSHKGT